MSDGSGDIRRIIPLEPGVLSLGTATTDTTGAFAGAFEPTGGKLLVEGPYEGTTARFPAYAAVTAP